MLEVIKCREKRKTILIDDLDVNKTYVSLLNGEYKVLMYSAGSFNSIWGSINNSGSICQFGSKKNLFCLQDAINYILDQNGKVFVFNSIDEALKAGLK